MPAPKRLDLYPQEYWEIAQRVVVKREQMVLQYPSAGPALTFRNRWWGFVKALERERDRLEGTIMPEDITQLERVKDALAVARHVVVWVTRGTDGTANLTLMHREDTPEAIMLREMLGTKSIDQEALASQERFRKMMEQNNG